MFDLYTFSVLLLVLNGKVMRKVGVEVIGLGALKLTSFLRSQMQQHNVNFDSLYTVRTLKEVTLYSKVMQSWHCTVSFPKYNTGMFGHLPIKNLNNNPMV